MDPTGSQLVELDQVLGLSSLSNAALCSSNGDTFYAAGCVCVRYNPLNNLQVDHYIASKPISCVKVSPCGVYLAVGERGHLPSISVWNIKTKTLSVKLMGHKHGVGCIAFSPDSRFIVSCGFKYDKQLMVWDWANKDLHEAGVHGDAATTHSTSISPICSGRVANKVHAIDYHESGKYFVTCGDKHLKFWTLSITPDSRGTYGLSGKPGSITEALKDGVFMDVVCGTGPVSDMIYCTTANGVLCAFHESRLMDKWLQLESPTSYCLTLFSKGNAPGLLVVGCAEGIIRAFDPSTLTYLATLPLPQPLRSYESELNYPACYGITMVAGSPKAPAPKLCAIYADRSLLVWDISEVESVVVQYRSFSYHRACIWDVALIDSPTDENGSTTAHSLPAGSFATCSVDGTVRLWNLDRQQQRQSPWRSQFSREMLHCIEMGDLSLKGTASSSALPSRPSSAGSNSNSRKLQQGGGQQWKGVDSSVDLSAGLPDCELPSSFNAGGASGTNNNNKDGDSGRPSTAGEPSSSSSSSSESVAARCLAVHPSGTHLACGDKSGTVRVFDLRSMREVRCLNAHAAEVLTLHYGPLCSKAKDGSDWVPSVPGNDEEESAAAAAATADGDSLALLASAGRDRLVHVYNAQNDYSHVTTLDNHSSSITIVKFTPDGRRLLSCGGDKTLVVTKVQGPDLTRLKTISSPHGTINGIAVEATNRFAIASGQDKRLNIYNIISGKHVRSYRSPGITTELYKADIDPSGMFVVVTGFDKSINIFDFFSGELLTTLIGHAEVVTCVKFTTDGRHILSVGGDGTIMRWRVSDGLVSAMQDRLLELHGEASRKAQKQEAKAAAVAAAAVSRKSSSGKIVPPPPPANAGADNNMMMPPPPPSAPEASAPVPVVPSTERAVRKSAVPLADTVGVIIPTVKAGTGADAGAETGTGTATSIVSAAGGAFSASATVASADLAASGSETGGGVWNQGGSFELFGKKADPAGKKKGGQVLNKFTAEVELDMTAGSSSSSSSSSSSKVLNSTNTMEKEQLTSNGDDSTNEDNKAEKEQEEEEEEEEEEGEASAALTATERLESDDVVVVLESEDEEEEGGEEEEERRYFGNDLGGLSPAADGGTSPRGQGGYGMSADGDNDGDNDGASSSNREEDEEEQAAARRLDALEQSVSDLEGWLEKRLHTERSGVRLAATSGSHGSEADADLGTDSGTGAGAVGSPRTLVSRSLTSDYLTKALRQQRASGEGGQVLPATATTANANPPSPSSSSSATAVNSSSPRGSRSAGNTPERSGSNTGAIGNKRRETAAALALMNARLRGMGVYEEGADAAGEDEGEVDATTTSTTTTTTPAAAATAGGAPDTPTRKTAAAGASAGGASTGRRNRRLVKRKPPTISATGGTGGTFTGSGKGGKASSSSFSLSQPSATAAADGDGEGEVSSPRRPVPRERYPADRQKGINAININNSIDVGRLRSGSVMSDASPLRSSKGSPSKKGRSQQQQQQQAVRASKDKQEQEHEQEAEREREGENEVSVASDMTFGLSGSVSNVRAAAAPAAAAGGGGDDGSDTDSTVTDDEREPSSSTAVAAAAAAAGAGAAAREGEGQVLQEPWDGDVTSPEADAAMARGVIQSMNISNPPHTTTTAGAGAGVNNTDTAAAAMMEVGEVKEDEVAKALQTHQAVLASLEKAQAEALRSYSDLVSLQSNLVRASSSSSVASGGVGGLLGLMGETDSILASYRESLSFSNAGSVSASFSTDHHKQYRPHHSITNNQLKQPGSSKGSPSRATGAAATAAATVGGRSSGTYSTTAGSLATSTASHTPLSSAGASRDDDMGSSTIATSMSMTGTSGGADTPQNLDDLLEKHSNKILDKLLSKLSPQQRALLSDLQEGEEEETA